MLKMLAASQCSFHKEVALSVPLANATNAGKIVFVVSMRYAQPGILILCCPTVALEKCLPCWVQNCLAVVFNLFEADSEQNLQCSLRLLRENLSNPPKHKRNPSSDHYSGRYKAT